MYNKLSYKINIFGEFSDVNQEYEYQQHDMKKLRMILKLIIILMESLNMLFLIPDYSRYDLKDFQMIAIAKIIFLIFVIVLLSTMDHIKPNVLSIWITLFETCACIVYLMGMYYQDHYNFFLQALGMTVVIMAVFIVPNRLIYKSMVGVFNFISFIVIALNIKEEIAIEDMVSGFSYLLVVLVFCLLTSYNIQYTQRMNYVNGINLMKLSMTDFLTQTYNRSKLENDLNSAIQDFHKNRRPLSLVMFDFDNFKIINDTFGHIDGDKLMVEVTSIVKGNIREEDIFARWGGDEFVILLPNKNKACGVTLAERLRERIANNQFNVSIDIKCSFGVAQLLPEDDSISLIRRADQMLYLAKEAGGNCVKA